MHTYYLCEKYILFFLMFLQVKLEDVKTLYIFNFTFFTFAERNALLSVEFWI